MRKGVFLTFALILSLTLAGGCSKSSNSNMDSVSSKANSASLQSEAKNPDGFSQSLRWDHADKMDDFAKKKAKKFTAIAVKEKNVNSAQAYVVSNTAFITLLIDDDASDAKVISKVKKELTKADKKMNFNIISDRGAFDQMTKSQKSIRQDAVLDDINDTPIEKIENMMSDLSNGDADTDLNLIDGTLPEDSK